jgi:hypothetical protein
MIPASQFPAMLPFRRNADTSARTMEKKWKRYVGEKRYYPLSVSKAKPILGSKALKIEQRRRCLPKDNHFFVLFL